MILACGLRQVDPGTARNNKWVLGDAVPDPNINGEKRRSAHCPEGYRSPSDFRLGSIRHGLDEGGGGFMN